MMLHVRSIDARSTFERLLAARQHDLATLAVRDGVAAMLAFYRATRADDCDLADDGDMLLFQWGPTYLVDGPTPYVVDITRQFIPTGGEDEDIWQLALTFVVDPRRSPPATAGARAPCSSTRSPRSSPPAPRTRPPPAGHRGAPSCASSAQADYGSPRSAFARAIPSVVAAA